MFPLNHAATVRVPNVPPRPCPSLAILAQPSTLAASTKRTRALARSADLRRPTGSRSDGVPTV